MTRGTTPTHIFNIPIDGNTIKTVRITYKQQEVTRLEKTEADVEITTGAIKLRLSQEDTLAFVENIPVQVQVKVLIGDGTVLASHIKSLPVGKVLNEEVLE